jgi:steroid 5-alpha reductase family enzyme
MMTKTKGLLTVLFAYTIAIGLGVLSILYNLHLGDMLQIFIADLIATFMIYCFSVAYKNSSFYDPYWSVIPPFILLFWIWKQDFIFTGPVSLLIFAMLFWSIRLTTNWIKTWEGLHHEDWRYVDMRKNLGSSFEFLGNFGGIHFFPTLIVFFCCMPMGVALQLQEFMPDTNMQAYAGFFICILGVLYEIISDAQLHRFREENPHQKGIIETGLWNYSRHPNYYGEILFWWGIFLFGNSYLSQTEGLGLSYLILAPIVMTLMFWYASIPWIEIKILRTRPAYKDYQQRVHILFPEITILKRLIKK